MYLSHVITGKINVPNLALPYSAACSGVTSMLFSGIVTVGVSLIGKSFSGFSCFPLIDSEVVDTAPADYNFLGTRGISVIDPIASGSEEEKENSKQGSEEDTSPNSPSSTPEVQSRRDASVKELERDFRRAMWPSLALTITVMVVCVFSQSLCCVVLNIHATHRSYLYRCSSRTTCFLTRSSVFG